MPEITNFIHSDYLMYGLVTIMFITLIALLLFIVKLSKLNKHYQKMMVKLGNGKNIEEDLETYFYRMDKIEKQNVEIVEYCQNLDNQLSNCVQKVGIVRYNAFKDTGSDLSFALALLDENNNGVVLNGIYSREMSNIYAKPVEKGKSTYTLSDEENQAIEKAMRSREVYKVS